MAHRIDRRAVLRGLGSVAIALPALEIMLNRHGTALADETPIPKRYFVGVIGQALSGDDAPTNLYVPDKAGLDYDLKLALMPLASVKQHVSVVSNMEIVAAGANGGVVPAGGRDNDFHCSSMSPLLSGMRSNDATATCYGPTSDQVVANAIGTTTVKSLVLNCPADFYLAGGYQPYGRQYMSFSGSQKPVEPTISPQQVFRTLFGNFAAPDAKGPDPDLDFARRSRRSVLDLVSGNTERLMQRLGKADKERMQAHLTQIRELEKRIGVLPPVQTQICSKPGDPGSDPALNTGARYSGEKERAKVFGDLIHMAFACDLTRVATLMYSMFQSHMAAGPVTGNQYSIDLHELGHSIRTAEAVASGMQWQVEAFANLVARLQSTPEGAGTMLDSCALVLLNEGGHGKDYLVASHPDNQTHSTERMACLVAGRAGGLKAGRHVVTNKAHPAQVLLTAMRAVGAPMTTLGEVTGTIPELMS